MHISEILDGLNAEEVKEFYKTVAQLERIGISRTVAMDLVLKAIKKIKEKQKI